MNLFNFFKRCEHDFVVTCNKDLYEKGVVTNVTDALLNNPQYHTYTIKYTLPRKVEYLLKRNGITVEQLTDVISKCETDKDKEIKQLKQKIRNDKRRVVGHYTCCCCKKCGQILDKVIYF